MKQLIRPETILGFAITLMLAGCMRQEQSSPSLTFASPNEAVAAFVAALEKRDMADLRRILGPGTDALLTSGDDVNDSAERGAFLKRFRARHQLVSGGPDDLVLQVGEDDWPLPIPLVKESGRWRFDGAAGAEKLIRLRVGANELRTIDVMRGFVAAQEDYAAESHDGEPAGVYAQKLRSDEGKHNGLYWTKRDGEPESPAGPFLASAAAEGYGAVGGQRTPYHGYLYRQLLAQGDAANGGARDYLVNGKLVQGFALIAYPADYGASGVTTFIVNQDGVVWQRDLGDSTTAAVAAIQKFNPDSTWTPIPPEGEF